MSSDLLANEAVRCLRDEFISRKQRNPNYTLRSFAKSLGVPPGRLSEIFSNNRRLTINLASSILNNLDWSVEKRSEFLDYVFREKLGKAQTRAGATASPKSHFTVLQEEYFRLIAEWYHYAILSLVETKGFQATPQWISKRLNISSIEAQDAFERLQKLDLIKMVNGKWSPKQSGVTTTHDVPSAALRMSHKQEMEIAIKALDDIPVELRDVTSITIAVDMKRLAAAKEKIKLFRREMAGFLNTKDTTEVYTLNIQLVPLTVPNSQKDS